MSGSRLTPARPLQEIINVYHWQECLSRRDDQIQTIPHNSLIPPVLGYFTVEPNEFIMKRRVGLTLYSKYSAYLFILQFSPPSNRTGEGYLDIKISCFPSLLLREFTADNKEQGDLVCLGLSGSYWLLPKINREGISSLHFISRPTTPLYKHFITINIRSSPSLYNLLVSNVSSLGSLGRAWWFVCQRDRWWVDCEAFLRSIITRRGWLMMMIFTPGSGVLLSSV